MICPWRSGDLVSLVSEVAPRSSSQVKSSQVARRSKDRLILSTSSIQPSRLRPSSVHAACRGEERRNEGVS